MAVSKDAFVSVLADSDAFWPQMDFVRRPFECPAVEGKATALVGVRRAGKTTLMRQTALDWIAQRRITLPQVLFVNFSDDRLTGVSASDLSLLMEAHYQLHPDLPREQGLAFFLDEIQLVSGWELFVDRILRDRRNRVVLSGSSAKLLSTEIATEMRGRSLSVEIFPLSFAEFMAFHGSTGAVRDEKERGRAAALADRYIRCGGFPEVQRLSEALQKQVLQEYLHLLYARDVIERHNPGNPYAVRTLIQLALNSVAAPFTFTKAAKRLKSMGIAAAPGDVGEYLSWTEDCGLLSLVPIYSESRHKRNTNPRKPYCVDNGLISATQAGLSAKLGTRLENAVFGVLRRSRRDIFYFKTKDGHEVDFLVQRPDGSLHLIQACASLQDEATREREVRALVRGGRELGAAAARLVTIGEQAVLTRDGITVEVEPFYRFALTKA